MGLRAWDLYRHQPERGYAGAVVVIVLVLALIFGAPVLLAFFVMHPLLALAGVASLVIGGWMWLDENRTKTEAPPASGSDAWRRAEAQTTGSSNLAADHAADEGIRFPPGPSTVQCGSCGARNRVPPRPFTRAAVRCGRCHLPLFGSEP